MYNFTYSIPTVIHFGKGKISRLADLKKSGNSVLYVYGGGSIKKSDLYDTSMKILKDAGLSVVELSGIEPNPRIESVRKGVELCKQNHLDMVLAVGGGSVIDAAKVIAAGALYDGDAWDLVLDSSKIKGALPIFSVLTLSATGSEMDTAAVISDMAKNEKWATGAACLRPTMSVLDPTYTFTVSKKQTAAGTADMISHTFEAYFTYEEGATLQAHMCEAVLRTAFQYGPIAYNDPENYEARANLMWASSWAINGALEVGCGIDWTVHPIEHELSAFYDITHGEGLAILTPHWMRTVMKKKPETVKKFADYGREVWHLSGEDQTVAEAAVKKTEDYFFNELHLPKTLRDVGINEKTNFKKMAEKAVKGRTKMFVQLTEQDVVDIFEAAF